jgi:hypothetical protein
MKTPVIDSQIIGWIGVILLYGIIFGYAIYRNRKLKKLNPK